MKVVETDGYRFCFNDALDAFVFDEKDKSKPTYHGLPMKAVDIVAEFQECYIFIELKDYDDVSEFNIQCRLESTSEETKKRQDSFRWLKNYLKYKFRDTYLCRHAEQKNNKPIRYICLLNFDNALNAVMQKSLKAELPVGKKSRRWVQELAISCHVMSINKWNEKFSSWPITRLSSAAAPQGA